MGEPAGFQDETTFQTIRSLKNIKQMTIIAMSLLELCKALAQGVWGVTAESPMNPLPGFIIMWNPLQARVTRR